MKSIVFSKQARKALMRMPSNEARSIIGKIEQYAEDPASLSANVKRLSHAGGALRLRVGDWRVIMLDGVVIDVLKIAPRGGAYG